MVELSMARSNIRRREKYQEKKAGDDEFLGKMRIRRKEYYKKRKEDPQYIEYLNKRQRDNYWRKIGGPIRSYGTPKKTEEDDTEVIDVLECSSGIETESDDDDIISV